MCGIAGGHWKNPNSAIENLLDRALYSLRLRGPNDSGVDIRRSTLGATALVHARLSVIDLSSGGHQPRFSRDNRFGLIFNGEIYNYRELRIELKALGHEFLTNSDTEVLIEAWQEWGPDCLRRLDGMFAFAVHDREWNRLTLMRDAFGIKPLFYSADAERFLFASTVSALRDLRNGKEQPDLQRCYDYLVHGDYDSNGESFVNGIQQVQPGELIEANLVNGTISTPRKWWQPAAQTDRHIDFETAAELVRDRFLSNVRLQLRSDVDLGSALSGGIDSSAVVCAIRHLEPDIPIKTFSYVADDGALSEESWVDLINTHVRALPHKTSATSADLERDLDDMIRTQDEPFGSTSIYAQYRVFQLARENGVTVTLDGQGADEVLAGYSGYPGFRLLSMLENLEIGAAAGFLGKWSKWPGRSTSLGIMELGRVALPDHVYGISRKLLGRDFKPAWLDTEMLDEAGVRFIENRPFRQPVFKGRRVVEQLSHSLQGRGLPALLRHADRNSMRFSVESRVPFLTLELAELLLSLPEQFLISPSGETKSVFRHAMRGIVPDAILDRRDKIGFATPEQKWLLQLAPLFRDWIKESAGDIPFIKVANLLAAFDDMAAGRARFTWQMWRWVNYVRWYHWQQFS